MVNKPGKCILLDNRSILPENTAMKIRFQLQTQQAPAPTLTMGLLALLLAWQAGYWLVKLTAPAPLPTPATPLAAPAAASATAWRNLFVGNGVATGPLLLKGVVLSGSGSVALLSLNGGTARAVQVGHELVPGLWLREVTAQGAVVERMGAREEVPLAKKTTPALNALAKPRP
jgi:general secretion pathway protein C